MCLGKSLDIQSYLARIGGGGTPKLDVYRKSLVFPGKTNSWNPLNEGSERWTAEVPAVAGRTILEGEGRVAKILTLAAGAGGAGEHPEKVD